MNPQNGFIAHYRGRTYAANVGPGSGDVVLFTGDEPTEEGFERAHGYWRKRVPRTDLSWLVLLRTVGIFGGEPCVVLAEESDGLHIAYAGHDGLRARKLGYWQVDHGAHEVVVAPEEVYAIRVERLDFPAGPDWHPHSAPA
ncbi:hypothetical protein [Bailinhaonella thermotolerans]|uniref:Uncharacterized protein n=1 Tax=Bailinhaonella thermotolerans TaxID=1070861 RepID=A0A3A4ARR3_9ACTN|nr:hypothetical protein [Bailinhaonella thermotolerans]RJL31299.1 hypothetical protein D5H75_19790 [Bailinhaonella thermotolerans]